MTTLRNWFSDNADLPRLELELVAGHFLNSSRAALLAHPERQLSNQERSHMGAWLAQLRTHTPLAYLLGTREFWGLDLKVTPSVLIPRPETELLVEIAVDHIQNNAQIVDLGTGSGAISIAVGHCLREKGISAHLCASDVSADALAIARQNAASHNIEIDFIQSDWWQNIEGDWDAIISNPPYIRADDDHLPQLCAEPKLALVAGDDGFAALRAIIETSTRHLNSDGVLLLEHGYDQAEEVRTYMAMTGFKNVSSRQDLNGIERVSIGYWEPTT